MLRGPRARARHHLTGGEQHNEGGDEDGEDGEDGDNEDGGDKQRPEPTTRQARASRCARVGW